MRRILVSILSIWMVLPATALDKNDPRQMVLDASHSTRINDVDMKPWHLKLSFRLGNDKGQQSEEGTIEEWWAGLTLWKLRIESPSYTSTVIENRDGDFRTEGIGAIPLPIRAIEQDIVYPMPMGEDLSRTVPRRSHQKLDKKSLDCIQLSEPPIPLPSPSFCFDKDGGALRAIISSNSSMLVRDQITEFAGHAPAFSIRSEKGNAVVASAKVIELSQMQPAESMFTPSSDMNRVTDMHTFKITTAH